MDIVFSDESGVFGNLDYVAAWFVRAADYAKQTKSHAAFVTTNSLFQGEQVPLLWPLLNSKGTEYGFSYRPFKWANSAAKNAGVICVIVCIRPISNSSKSIFGSEQKTLVTNINPYLVDAPDIFVERRSASLAGLPPIDLGSAPKDGGHLMMDDHDMAKLVGEFPEASRYVKPIFGSQEYIQGISRFCLWISDQDVDDAKAIAPISERLSLTAQMRSESPKLSTASSANWPHRFNELRHQEKPFIIIPRVSSSRRSYLTVGFLPAGTIATDSAFAIYDPPTWVFSVLSSSLHRAWTGAVGGRLKEDYRYSNTLVYNTFPSPNMSADQKLELEEHALNILRIREPYIGEGKTIAWLYNPETMPANLLQAHYDLDIYLETIYIGRPFKDDAERLEHLFKLYARMTKTAAKAA